MFHCCRLFIGLVLLTFFASGCGESGPATMKNLSEPDSNIPDVSTTLSTPVLAPTLPDTQFDITHAPRRLSYKGLTAIGSPMHHFGEVKQNAELRHDFVLTNNVDIHLRIIGMRSSCTCTWSENNDSFVGSTIEPGQKIDYPVFLNTGTLQDRASGQILFIYRYMSDDSVWDGEEILTLEVVGKILPDYRIEPVDLSFGEIISLVSPIAKKHFRVTPVNMELLEILNIKSSSSFYTVNIVSSDVEGYEVEVTFDGSSLGNSERVHGHLVIETNSKTVPRGLVNLSASYVAPITLEPSFVLIGSDKEGVIREEVQIFSSVPSQIGKVDMGVTDLVRAEFDSALKAVEHTIAFSIDPCDNAAIDETVTIHIILFPTGGKVVTQTFPVTVYRFHKGE